MHTYDKNYSAKLHENMHNDLKYKYFAKYAPEQAQQSQVQPLCKICMRACTTMTSRTTSQNMHANRRNYHMYAQLLCKICTRKCATITTTLCEICTRTYSRLQVLLLHVPGTVPISKAISDYSSRFARNSGGWNLRDAQNLKTKS